MISVLVNEIDIMGGTHKQVLRFCEYLESRGENFELVTKYLNLDKTYPDFNKFNIKYLLTSKRKINRIAGLFYDFFLQFKIYLLINKNAKILNIHDNGLPLVILLARVFGKKIYWQINDLPGGFSVGNAKSKNTTLLRSLYKLISRFFYKKVIVKCVHTITVNVAKNRERVNLLLNRDATVLYCGVDRWKGKNIDRLGYSNSIKLLSSGVFFPYRNYETQVKLVKKMKQSGMDVELNIIGSTLLDTVYSEKIKNLVDSQKLSDCIKIHGQVTQEEYIKLHENSDLFIFINIDQSWGLAVFEAMSSGLPVIVSNSVGATEVLHDGVDSFFVDPIDVDQILLKITTLKNFEKYKQMSTAAHNYVTELTWDNMYSKKLFAVMKGDAE